MENSEKMTRVQKMTFSAMVMALYIVILYCTQSFSFGAYQIRIATSLYALSYLFPFLVFPLGLANFISNMLFGGFGIADMAGGFIVGILTAGCVVFIRKMRWKPCPYRSTDSSDPGIWRSNVSVLLSVHALSSYGTKLMYRTGHTFYRGGHPGQNP